MTNERDGIYEFQRYLDESNEVSKTADQRKDDRTSVQGKSDKQLRAYAYKIAKERGYEVKSPEALSQEDIGKFIEMGQRMARNNAANMFESRLDSILKQIPSGSLEALVGDENAMKDILSSAPERDREAIASYFSYKKIEEILERYKANGEIEDERIKKQVINAAAGKVARAEKENLKKQGYNLDVQELGESLAIKAMERGYFTPERIKKYAIEGLKDEAVEAKRNYEKLAGEEGVANSIRNSLKRMAGGSREDFNKAMLYAYGTSKVKTKAA